MQNKNPKKFFSIFKISKINFYSTIKYCFNQYTYFNYYPLLTKALLENILSGNKNYLNFYSELKKYESIYEKIKYMINHKKNISYRFEFRMILKDVQNLTNRITNLFRRDHFTFIKNSELQANALKNFENMINIIKTMPKAIINIGQFMLLETLMISGFLRGDYFLMPFSTCNLRTIEKNFWKNNRDVICDNEYFKFIQNDYNLLLFEEF